jgi:hypothetical protein
MPNNRPFWLIAVFLAAATLSTSLHARGLMWNFLADTYLDAAHDHDKIQVSGRHDQFRALQLRISGDAIFLQRVVVRYSNGAYEDLAVGRRILPEGTQVFDLTGESRVLESIELWYFQEPWEHHPRARLYGTR